jgi:hypothetical protein
VVFTELLEIDLYQGAHEAAWARLKEGRREMERAHLDSMSIFDLIEMTTRARTLLALGRLDEAQKVVRKLEKRTPEWGAAIGCAVDASILRARGQPQAVARMHEAIRRLEEWDLGLYVAAARYRLAQWTQDSEGENAAQADLKAKGVRVPERAIQCLLPLPRS